MHIILWIYVMLGFICIGYAELWWTGSKWYIQNRVPYSTRICWQMMHSVTKSYTIMASEKMSCNVSRFVIIIHMPWLRKTFNRSSLLLSVAERSKLQLVVRKVGDSNPAWDIYFNFEFSAFFQFLTAWPNPYTWDQAWHSSRKICL